MMKTKTQRLQGLRHLGNLGKLNDEIKSEGQGLRREHNRYAHKNRELRRQRRGTNIAATTPTI